MEKYHHVDCLLGSFEVLVVVVADVANDHAECVCCVVVGGGGNK